MKHYTEKFFISEQHRNHLIVHFNKSVLNQYTDDPQFDDWIKKNPTEWINLKDKILNAGYEVNTSVIDITKDVSKDKVDMYWHMKSLNGNAPDVNYVRLENIDNNIFPFEPEVFEFDAPAIGEKCYLWDDGSVYNVVVLGIHFEAETGYEYDPNRYHNILIRFKDSNGSRHIMHADSFEQLNKKFNELCKQDISEYDCMFWSKRYEELRREKDLQYSELQKRGNIYY